MELRDYLRILRRRWLSIVAFMLIGVGVGAAVTVLATPMYASTTRLFVSTPVSDTDNNALQGSQFASGRVASYANLIKGNAIAQKVIDQLHLTESPTDLTAQITATPVTNTVILEVTATDPSPARAQQLSQTTAEVFSAYIPTLEGSTPAGQAPIKATIVDAAPLPTEPVSPRPKLNLALGGLVGLFVGLGIAFLRETLDTTIKSATVLDELTKASTLGTIQYDALAPKRPLVSQIESTSARVESFRVLRTNLQFLNVDQPSRVFTVTSPLPGEGKSTTAANLAISLAEAGQRTLLLEADLRRPRVASYLSLEPAVGLTTVLIGKATIDDVVQPWGDSGLDVITSGSIPPNPAELLQSKAMETFLAEVRDRYQIVIVDATPLLPVTDAALVAAQTDGAILLVRFGKTTRDQASQAAQRLGSVGATLLGTILNFVPARGPVGYGYGYGYGYYGYAPKTATLTRREHRQVEKATKRATKDALKAGSPGPESATAVGGAASATAVAAHDSAVADASDVANARSAGSDAPSGSPSAVPAGAPSRAARPVAGEAPSPAPRPAVPAPTTAAPSVPATAAPRVSTTAAHRADDTAPIAPPRASTPPIPSVASAARPPSGNGSAGAGNGGAAPANGAAAPGNGSVAPGNGSAGRPHPPVEPRPRSTVQRNAPPPHSR